MALVHHATLSPSKQELVEAWLPSRGWGAGRTVEGKAGEYRFDDPAGEVGVETIVWTADDGALLQTPLTYRSAPLEGAEAFLVGTTDHSVLGERWVYDGAGDPVWAATLVTAIVTSGTQSQMYFEEPDGTRVDVPPRMQVRGSGSAAAAPEVGAIDDVVDDDATTLVTVGGLRVVLPRVLGTPVDAGDPAQVLTGTLLDDPTVLTLAGLREV